MLGHLTWIWLYAILIGVLRELRYRNQNDGGDVGLRIQDTITFVQSEQNAWIWHIRELP